MTMLFAGVTRMPTAKEPTMPAKPETQPIFGPDRMQLGDMTVVGVIVIVVGSIEVIDVRDGQFTAILQLGRYADRLYLDFPDTLREDVWDNLCHRVAAEGCMRHDADDKRCVLELHRITQLA
jgi:hypothetical protein